MVARNRKTYTCTVGQIVVVVAVVAKRETRTQIVTVAAINQSIKTPFTRESTVYTGLDKVLNGRIVSLYNPFTRNRANSVTVLLVSKFVQILPVLALEWLFNQRHGTGIYAFNALTVQKVSWSN